MFFDLVGRTSNQLGYWDALFGAVLPQSPDDVIARLDRGETLVSTLWAADITTAPEPAPVMLAIPICLLILVQRRWRVPGLF